MTDHQHVNDTPFDDKQTQGKGKERDNFSGRRAEVKKEETMIGTSTTYNNNIEKEGEKLVPQVVAMRAVEANNAVG